MKHRYNDETEVVAGSLWHADCDPFETIVVARPWKNDGVRGIFTTAERAMWLSIAAETERVLDQDCEEHCEDDCEEHSPDIRNSGMNWTTIGELGLDDDQIAELERDGYIHI